MEREGVIFCKPHSAGLVWTLKRQKELKIERERGQDKQLAKGQIRETVRLPSGLERERERGERGHWR